MYLPGGHADDGEVVPEWEQGVYGKPLPLPPNFAGSLKLLKKNEVFKIMSLGL